MRRFGSGFVDNGMAIEGNIACVMLMERDLGKLISLVGFSNVRRKMPMPCPVVLVFSLPEIWK